MIENKRAQLELSIGTIVILVIGVSMLILGMILVRNIMCSGMQITEDVTSGVRNQLKTLFGADQVGVKCQGEGGQEISLGTGGRRKVICLIKVEEQARYEITATNIESLKGITTDSANKWALVKSWSGDVAPGTEREADFLLLDIPRDAPASSLRVAIQIKNLNTGTEETTYSTLEVKPTGFVRGTIC